MSSLDILKKYGVMVSTKKALRRKATLFNHGRARKVSLKRASPQLSHKRLEQIKAQLVLEETLKR